MNWLEAAFFEPTMVQAVIIISLVSAVGIALGRIKIFGISLGITFVFFTGILAGHLGIVVNKDMLFFAQSFGLILFVYALGLQVGPGFFSSLKKGGIKMNSLSMIIILLDVLMVLGMHYGTGISLSDMVGLMNGAVTNTPALGAAQQTLLQIDPTNTKGVTDMALACAVTYPLGVVGVILAIIVLRKVFKEKEINNTAKSNTDVNMNIAEFHVSNPGVCNKPLKEIIPLTGRHLVISRVWRDGKVYIPTSNTQLKVHDHLLIISNKADVDGIRAIFGEQEDVDWNKPDIDWNAIDSQLISRRIAVTNDKMNGVKLGSLRLRNLYGINITRVNRAGIDLMASPDLHLQVGDRLTIVGEANSVETVGKLLGNEIKRLKNPNLISVFLGITLGMILGALPISVPGLSSPVKLGIAGGPIVVGILMGAFGSRFHLTTYTTMSANLMLRQLGLIIYLAGLGIDSGAHFFETVFRAEGLLWVGLGFLITLIPVLIVGFLATKLFKLDYAHNVGMLCGSMANPMALTYANTTVEGDAPSVSYATVYPLSMFIRVILSQLILLFFI